MPVNQWLQRVLSSRGLYLVASMMFAATTLASCMATVGEEDSRAPDVMDRIRSLDLLPRLPRSPEPSADQPDRRKPAVFNGTLDSLALGEAHTQPISTTNGSGYDLNFENSPLTSVAKVILSDILGLGYTIDPRVQGTMNLTSARPVPRSDLLYVLEDALRLSNVALVRSTAGYRLVPLGEAIGAGNVDRETARAEPGYGISVVPLRNVSAQTLMKLLDSFAMRPGTARADPARNILIIQGTGPERQAAIETALSFDVDWLRGQFVGIYPIQNSAPEPVIAELEKIVDSGEGGLGQNVIKFQPISRSNSVLVVTRRAPLLKTAAAWIARLDRTDSSPNGVHVYRVRYGEARQMARVLNDILVGGSSTSDTSLNQIAPGSGAIATSSADQPSLASPSGSGRARQQLGITPPEQRSFSQTQTVAVPSATNSASVSLDVRGSTGNGTPLMPGVRITPDAVNNSLLIYASQENYRIIERTIRQMDRPQLQVAIDATVAEVTLNNNLNYGVQFFLNSKDVGLKPDQGSVLNSSANNPPGVDVAGVAGAFINRAFPGFNFLIGPEKQPRVILDALHAITSVKVLSNPSLVVIDNQPATLQVGDDVPISTGSATVLTTNNTVVNTIDYRNTGIILRVVPRINVNGNIRLDIEQEISNVSPTAGSPSLTPTVSQRRVKSSISVASGQTVLLAGLISERQERGSTGIPFLDQLQIFFLFCSI